MTAPRTITAKLSVLPAQKSCLEETMAAFARACEYVWQYGQAHQLNQQLTLHQSCYGHLRTGFLLPANLAVRVIAWTALNLKQDPAIACPFPANQILFDSRTFVLDGQEGSVKLTLLNGREKFYLDPSSFPSSYLPRLSAASVTLMKRSSGYYLRLQVRVPQESLPAGEPVASGL
jgi:hypothetical protein